MSCDAGGEDHSKNWSVKRQRNSCFWLESCEKPEILPKVSFFWDMNILDRQVVCFSLQDFPQIYWPDAVTE